MRILFLKEHNTTVVVECKRLEISRHSSNEATIQFWDLDGDLYYANQVSFSPSEESFVRGALLDDCYIDFSKYQFRKF